MERNEKDGPVFKMKNDPRITRVGKFLRKTSIDEMPQLFNVLFGSMSLVGPRPERPYFVERFKEEIPRYMIKHQVRPGMTVAIHPSPSGSSTIFITLKTGLWDLILRYCF